MTPVFFASALTNFGIENFFDAFVNMAPSATPRTADLPDGSERTVDPLATPFSAYVFKLQANMNPRHRDSTAFLPGVFRPIRTGHGRETSPFKQGSATLSPP